MYAKLTEYIEAISIDSITEERRNVLKPLIHWISQIRNDRQVVRLNFICTHNSRRSHLSQVWAQAMAHYFGFRDFQAYSGGTEATALYPKVVETLQQAGFEISILCSGSNPIYSLKYAPQEHPLIGFSKTYDDAFNPTSAFAAIMTCGHADENCPHIPQAAARFAVTYEDPKAFDDSPLQAEKYQERSLQIAGEMKYVFSQIG